MDKQIQMQYLFKHTQQNAGTQNVNVFSFINETDDYQTSFFHSTRKIRGNAR
jgi:hypothetical protein